MRDLKSSRMMVLKAILFVLIGIIAAALLLADSPTLKTAALLALVTWSFSRAYYFAFYVIEKYIDPGYRFSGIFSATRHLLARRR